MHDAPLRHGWQSRQVLESHLHVGEAKDALAAPSAAGFGRAEVPAPKAP